MNNNKSAKSLIFKRGSEVGQEKMGQGTARPKPRWSARGRTNRFCRVPEGSMPNKTSASSGWGGGGQEDVLLGARVRLCTYIYVYVCIYIILDVYNLISS